MNPWLDRESIAEDVKEWARQYFDREILAAGTPEGQHSLVKHRNGLLDYLEAMMFQAESQAKDRYEEKHCEPGCCSEDREAS